MLFTYSSLYPAHKLATQSIALDWKSSYFHCLWLYPHGLRVIRTLISIVLKTCSGGQDTQAPHGSGFVCRTIRFLSQQQNVSNGNEKNNTINLQNVVNVKYLGTQCQMPYRTLRTRPRQHIIVTNSKTRCPYDVILHNTT